MLIKVLTPTRVLVPGTADGPVCATRQMLSFWGGVDPNSGTVIDHRHDLFGRELTAKIFVLPKGKGSSTGSPVLLDAWVAGYGPSAIVLAEVDEIISLGALVYREFFNQHIPVIVVDTAGFESMMTAKRAAIDIDGKVSLYD